LQYSIRDRGLVNLPEENTRMRLFYITSVTAVAVVLSGSCAPGSGSGAGNGEIADLVAKIDSIVNEPIEAGMVAGASVAVVKGSDTIALKGYGVADLEYDIPTPERAVYEIGSVTKQFTAVALLQLVEQGKVSLDDDLRDYLPDFPTQGNRITIRRLLDHTAGIRGYTEMPEFGVMATRKLPRDSLVAMFAKAPFDFPTGEQMIYSNSAYFLAGLIIEKVSGQSYADYVEEHLFERAGMPDSRYCSENAVYKSRAHGYDTDSTGALVRKGFIDHTYPYAAGSLCSTAWDLVAWNQALHGGKILGDEMYRELIAPGRLTDGTTLRYGGGLALSEVAGRPAIHHGGGIPGFLSQSAYLPDDDLILVVLFNTAGPVSPAAVVEEIAKAVVGEPTLRSQPFEGDYRDLVGTYTGVARGAPMQLAVVADGDALTASFGESDPDTLRYVGNDTFASGSTLVTFARENGSVAEVRVDRVYGYSTLRPE
jgi:CubicO group peptidase (beta-lactamase class C family)